MPGPSEKVPEDSPDDGTQLHVADPEQVSEARTSEVATSALYFPDAQATQFSPSSMYPILHEQSLSLTLPAGEMAFAEEHTWQLVTPSPKKPAWQKHALPAVLPAIEWAFSMHASQLVTPSPK